MKYQRRVLFKLKDRKRFCQIFNITIMVESLFQELYHNPSSHQMK